MTAPRRVPADLATLARLHGVLTSYEDARRKRRRATTEELLAGLGALGVTVDRPEDAAAAIPAAVRARWEEPVEPVVLAWGGRPAAFDVRLPARLADRPVRVTVAPEQGEPMTLRPERDAPVVGGADVDGRRFVARRVLVRARLPLGYHRLHVSVPGGPSPEATVIAAPRRAPGDPARRDWGVFLPLYSLHSRRSWGIGDLTDLEALMSWTGSLGGSVVATLPLLAQFLHTLHDPSPYSPASKLFWNEMYVDPERLPEAGAPEVRELLGSRALREEAGRLRRARLVDHDSIYLLRRRVLEACRRAADADPDRRRALDRHVREHPLLAEYARFRAVCERRQVWWGEWPARLRGTDDEPGTLKPLDGERVAERFHAYAQWVAEEQVAAIGRRDEDTGDGLFLDMPLGINPAGFDVWRFRRTFELTARVGAPPDLFFGGGQDWGFPPPHPDRIRRDGHSYLRRSLRHVLPHAGVLRLDHVMGLLRLYWIPPGMDATSGVYVRYPAEEQFAVLALETHRTDTEVVGEDLGIVPPRIHRLMDRHGVRRSYVLQFSVLPDPEYPLVPPEAGTFATVNTHDMPPFAAFWRALDVDDRVDLGLLDREEAERERRERAAVREAVVGWLVRRGVIEPPPPGVRLLEDAVALRVLEGCLRVLAAGQAGVVVANLEDLCAETRPQNVPGTSTERPNWRLRGRLGLDEMRKTPAVVEVLEMVDRARKEART